MRMLRVDERGPRVCRKWIGNLDQLVCTTKSSISLRYEEREPRKRDRGRCSRCCPFLSSLCVCLYSGSRARWKRAFLVATVLLSRSSFHSSAMVVFAWRKQRERARERGIKEEESKMDKPHKRGQAISSWTDNRCDYSQDVHWWWSVSKISF